MARRRSRSAWVRRSLKFVAHPYVRDDVELGRLAEEQTALRQVATLVARGAPPRTLFAVIAEQVARALHVPLVSIVRYEADGTATECASFSEQGELLPVGTRWPLDGANVVARVRETGRPARIDDHAGLGAVIAETVRRAGIRSTVGIPIVVAGRLWGAMVAYSAQVEPATASSDARLPDSIEDRLADFTALVATAISNSQAHEDLRRLADEQAALRRVATLVAEGATPAEVFAAVAREVGLVLKVPLVGMFRYEPDGTATVVGAIGEHPFQPGTNWPLDGPGMTAVVRRTGRPTRVQEHAEVPGTIQACRRAGFQTGVAAPIVVDAEVWGVVCAGAADPRVSVPMDAERRLSEFTALIATAVSNGAARSELLASRARIVEAADEQRRRVVRDMHDGAQSRLVHTVIALERAQAHDDVAPEVRELLEEGLTHARSAIKELRELAHGIHPAILTNNGLAAAIEVLADRTPLPVELEIPDERFPPTVESAAYFVAAEALTNVVKYARASTARIEGARTPAGLRLVVEDDGVGGAERAPGGGLAGLGDRVAALDGVLAIESPPGGGTRIRAEIPVPAAA